MWTITGHEHHVLASTYSAETVVCYSTSSKEHIVPQIDKDKDRKAAFRSVTTYLSMSWRRGKKDSGFPDTKAVSLPFPPFLVFWEETSQKGEKFSSAGRVGALLSCGWVSGSGGCSFCLLARAASVLCGVGHFAPVSPAPFLEICVSRSAVA